MRLDGTADLAKASQRDLLDTLAALPAAEPLRVAIRMEIAQRTIAHMTRQRIAKQRASQLRSRVKSDRASVAKAAAIDLSGLSNDDLATMAVTETDADKRSAALIEIGTRNLTGKWTKSSSPSALAADNKSAPAPAPAPAVSGVDRKY